MNFSRILALGASAVALAACANAPKPTAELGAASAAVAHARPDGARYAPTQLLTAQQKLAGARAAMDAEDFDRARRLSLEAVADARLAAAMVEAARARQALAEVQQGNQALRQELERRVP
jgi:hypothetical protein